MSATYSPLQSADATATVTFPTLSEDSELVHLPKVAFSTDEVRLNSLHVCLLDLEATTAVSTRAWITWSEGLLLS